MSVRNLGRRPFLKGVGALGGAMLLNVPVGVRRALAAQALTLADIGVGDPGDWSRFTDQTGHDVSVVAIGNAPSAIINQLLAGGGMQTFDVFNIVGGMQPPLVENDLIQRIDTSRIPNWEENTYIEQYLAEGTPGFDFIGHEGAIYGVPTVLQADSFAYLPEFTGELNSYGALFDPRHRGFVALEDNYTTAGQKTALYLKAEDLADIQDPSDLTEQELATVIDFLIEKKREGQFRVIWSSFEQAVNLLTSKEVHVMDCWEPMVFAARQQGTDAVYASPKEGYLLWAMAAYIVNDPNRSDEETQAVYDLLNFMLGPWYGAKITSMRGYMTNPQAPEFATSHPELFSPEEARRIAEIDANVKKKFEAGGTWQNRWPTHYEAYEEQWQRFKAS